MSQIFQEALNILWLLSANEEKQREELRAFAFHTLHHGEDGRAVSHEIPAEKG